MHLLNIEDMQINNQGNMYYCIDSHGHLPPTVHDSSGHVLEHEDHTILGPVIYMRLKENKHLS